jgi:FtsP/CotA-like multicopper oxidase with cupredoxin domain
MELTRRRLLRAAAGSTVAVAAPAGLTRGAAAGAGGPYSRALPLPEVLRGAQLHLPMVEAEVPILPGAPTRMWTYGGSFPGPLVRRPTGERTTARFSHRLPRAAGELTVHLHGGHNRSRDDGQPGGLTRMQPRSLYCAVTSNAGNDLLIRPGQARTYRYDFTEDGHRQRSALRFYHDHRLDRTGRNVWRGLVGMWISDDPLDRALPLPDGDRDLPLLICDRSFDRHNQLTDPFREPGHAPFDQVVGRHILVNGAVTPHHPVEACRYRLRVLNASNFRAFNLAVGGGATITQVGTESGLLPAPLERSRVLIGPAERVDLIVDFSRCAHRDVVLRSVARRGGPNRVGSRAYEGPLMEFRVGRRPRRDPSRVPAELRPLPGWVAEAPDEVAYEWRISVGGGFSPSWLLNDRTFDPGRVDHRARLGSTEAWRLVNDTKVAHVLHLHHTDWHVLSRNGHRPPPWERGLKESFLLDPGDKVVVAGRFSDYVGKYVVHCHMLEHEDHGLMGQFATV